MTKKILYSSVFSNPFPFEQFSGRFFCNFDPSRSVSFYKKPPSSVDFLPGSSDKLERFRVRMTRESTNSQTVELQKAISGSISQIGRISEFQLNLI